jgi:hypothetical protein
VIPLRFSTPSSVSSTFLPPEHNKRFGIRFTISINTDLKRSLPLVPSGSHLLYLNSVLPLLTVSLPIVEFKGEWRLVYLAISDSLNLLIVFTSGPRVLPQSD